MPAVFACQSWNFHIFPLGKVICSTTEYCFKSENNVSGALIMVICKNATEYMRKFNNLMADSFQELMQKTSLLNEKYREPLDNLEGMAWKNLQRKYDKELSDISHNSVKPLLDFEKSQPDKPIFIFKANRKYYKLKIDLSTGEYTKLKKPIPDIRLLRRQKPGWIVEYTFAKAFDFVPCRNCQREYWRINPNEKYCHFCRRSPKSKRPNQFINSKKSRHCLECEKEIPSGKNKRTKYCCGACRQAAWKKKVIISPVGSEARAFF